MTRRRAAQGAIGLLLAMLTSAGAATADDRHAGYYYPESVTTETYVARAKVLAETNRTRRIGFVVALTQALFNRPYPPQFSAFVKGDAAEKLIIVALEDGYINTLYRARALLAQMTSVARTTPLFAELGVEDEYVFFDMLRLLGFEQLTISDGESFAHQVQFE